MAEPQDDDEPGYRARWALILAAVAVLLVQALVPFGEELLYPFTLMATWVHEMGHGLTALAVGGRFESLDVFWNASGLAHTRGVAPGWPQGLQAIGGLLAPPLVGASILAFARGPRRATFALFALAGLMLLSVPIWVRSLTGFVMIPLVAAAVGLLAWRGGDGTRHVAAQGLGLLLGLDTVFGLDYLFTGQVVVDGRELPSDIANVGTHLGGPWILWGLLLAAASLALVAGGLRIAWMGDAKLPRLPRLRRQA